jgi:hypothetical protein
MDACFHNIFHPAEKSSGNLYFTAKNRKMPSCLSSADGADRNSQLSGTVSIRHPFCIIEENKRAMLAFFRSAEYIIR